MAKTTEVMTAAKAAVVFTRLQAEYMSLKKAMTAIRERMQQLPLVGHYPPNAVLYLCERCSNGPFNAHEIRIHRPKCEGDK